MKKLKKFISVGLCAIMLVPFAACSDPLPESSTSKEELATAQAAAYMDSALTTLQNAKSVKITYTSKSTETEEYFGDGTQVVDPEMTYSYTSDGTAEITLTEDGDGLAMYVVFTEKYISEDYENVYIKESIIKDGYTYSRSYMELEEGEEEPLWAKESGGNAMISPETLVEILQTKEVEDGAKKLLDHLESEIAEKILAEEVVDGKVVVDYDYKDYLNGWVSYFNSVDETQTTLGSVLNKLLGEVSADLKVENLLQTLITYSNKTVAEALTSLDAALAEKYGTSLQAIKDLVVNSEIMGVIFTDVMNLDETEIAEIKDWKFESLKTGEYGSVKIGEIINDYLLNNDMVPVPEEGEEEVDYVGKALTNAVASLSKTLAELDMNFDMYEGMEIKAFDGNTSFTFDESNALTEWSACLNKEVKENAYESLEESGETVHVGYETEKTEIGLTVAEISSAAATVEAPAKDEQCIGGSYKSVDENLRINSSTANGIEGYMEFETEEGGLLFWVDFETSEVWNEYGQTFTVTVTDAGGWGGAYLKNVEATAAYFGNNTVVFNLTINEDGTYEVSNFPTEDDMIDWYYNEYQPTQNA